MLSFFLVLRLCVEFVDFLFEAVLLVKGACCFLDRKSVV